MRILIVEDDRLVAMAAVEALEAEGHEICGPAHDAAHAMALAQSDRPELAFIDINLDGDDDGVDLARRLMAEQGLNSVFVSGQTSMARSNTDAALGFLQKPYAPDQLIRSALVAQALMSGWRASSSSERSIEIFGV